MIFRLIFKKQSRRHPYILFEINFCNRMEEGVLENRFICRACLKIVEHTAQSFGYVDDATGNLRDMLMCCVPEMDIFVSINPIICFSCIQGLILVHNFKSRCINTETLIRAYMQKYNLSEENTINLGSVVRDLIEVNNFYKQLQMEQNTLNSNLKHSVSPPPLHFLKSGDSTTQNTEQEYNLQDLPVEPKSSIEPVPPVAPLPTRSFLPVVPESSQLVNGTEHFLTSTTIPDQICENLNVNINNHTNLNSVKNGVNEHLNKDGIKNNKNDKELYIHPIESKMRLVVRIPRSKLSAPFMECTSLSPNHHDESSKFNETFAKEELPDENGITLKDQEMISFENTMHKEEKDSINNFYNSEVNEIPPNNHITKLYNCSCMYLTTSTSLFEEHKKKCKVTKTGPKNLFRCPHCPHITNRPYALDKHINNMHTKAIWFVCEFCTYRSTDKAGLRRHVRKNHEQRSGNEPGRQFPCHLCSMVMTSEYNYNRHLLKHEETVNTTYNCEFCSYYSKDRSNYRKHIFTHNPNQLQCPACSYNNVSPYQLRAHIKKNHEGVGLESADCRSDIPIVQLVEEIRVLINTVKDDIVVNT